MSKTICTWLDDFLDAQLSDADRAAFDRHLESCADCAHAVRFQQRIDRLLASAGTELGVVPPALVARIERRLAGEPRPSRWKRAIAVSSAAVVLLAAGIWYASTNRNRTVGQPHVASSDRRTPVPEPRAGEADGAIDTDSRPPVRLIFDAESDAIAVPIASEDPKVSIFWIYPIGSTAQGTNQPSGDFPDSSSGS